MKTTRLLAGTLLGGGLIVGGLWLSAGVLATLDPGPVAARTIVSPASAATPHPAASSDAAAATGGNVAAGGAAGGDGPAVPAPSGTVEPGVDVAGGRAAARSGFRAAPDPELAWIGNPLATPLLIANGQVRSRPVALRFRAAAAGCVTSFRMWWRYSDPDKPESTYSGGDGGRYLVELRPDDGTGAPADAVLDAGTFAADVARYPNDVHDHQFREVVFDGEACLERGRTYHVVLANVSADPDTDFLSFNGPYLRDAFQNPDEANACPECTDHAVLRREGDGSWILYPDDHTPAMVYLPFWCAALDTGIAVGQSLQYGLGAVDPAPLVSGARRVRQRYVPGAPAGGDPGEASDPDDPGAAAAPRAPAGPATLSFHARHLAGDDPLEVRVAGAAAGSVAAPPLPPTGTAADPEAGTDADARAFDWYSVELPGPLPTDAPFEIEFATAATSAYELGAAVRTARTCGVPVAGDAAGRAEVSDDGGATWRGPTVFGKDDKPNVQLSLVLREKT